MAQGLIHVIHGPNLNLLGRREPKIYGSASLETLNATLAKTAERDGVGIAFFQSNHEGALIDAIHDSAADGFVINPGAYGHTSIALRDALLAVQKPFIEVHLSNVHAREEFRKTSYLSDIALGVVSGLGPLGYEMSLKAMILFLRRPNAEKH